MQEESNSWLCRNCNTLVGADIAACPKCGADRPEEESMEATPEGIEGTVIKQAYSNSDTAHKPKYNFRESVLINAADITFVLGLFCAFASLVMPLFIRNIDNINLWSISIAIALFAVAIVSWALLRTIADISYRLRNSEHSKTTTE